MKQRFTRRGWFNGLALMVLAAGAGVRGEPASRPATGTIREVDFKSYTYPESCGQAAVKLEDSAWEDEKRGFRVELAEVLYGDLTGDGIEEALVRLSCWSPVGPQDELYVYTPREGQPVPLEAPEGGSGNIGGVRKVEIVGDTVQIERAWGPLGQKPDVIETETLRWKDGKFVQVGEVKSRRYPPGEHP